MIELILMMVAIIAFACLLGAMPRHQMALFGRKLSAQTTSICRVTGWSLLAALLAGNIAASGLAYGLCSFIGSCTAGASCVTLFFCWQTARKERQVQFRQTRQQTPFPAPVAPHRSPAPARLIAK